MKNRNKEPPDNRFKKEVKYTTKVVKIDEDGVILETTEDYILINTNVVKHRYKTRITTYVTKTYRHSGQQRLF